MDRFVALVLLAVSLVLFGYSVEADAQTYAAPAGTSAQTAPGAGGR